MPSPISDSTSNQLTARWSGDAAPGRLLGWSVTSGDREVGRFPTEEAAQAAAELDAGYKLDWAPLPEAHRAQEGGDVRAMEHARVYAQAWNSIAGYREEAEAAAALRAEIGVDRASRRYRVEPVYGPAGEAVEGAEYVVTGSTLYVLPAQDGWALRCESSGEILGVFGSRASALAEGRQEHARRERGTMGGHPVGRLLALFGKRG
jgi:hypothetical protein